jgi:hypothetical protein
MGFMDRFRRGCAEARTARGVPPLEQWNAGADGASDEGIEDDPPKVRIAELAEMSASRLAPRLACQRRHHLCVRVRPPLNQTTHENGDDL